MNETRARRIIAPEFQSRGKFGKHSIRQVFIPDYAAKPRNQGFNICFECLYIWMSLRFLHLLRIELRICEEIGIEVQQSPALPGINRMEPVVDLGFFAEQRLISRMESAYGVLA